jgi:cell fate (sporulation/competence/biofilm development) regulator YmcA (YheA/YmcA/DUF963 family)
MADEKQPSEGTDHWKAAQENLRNGHFINASIEELKALNEANKAIQGPEAVAHWRDAQEHLKQGHLVDASLDEIKALSAAAVNIITAKSR